MFKLFWRRGELPRSVKVMRLMILIGIALSVAALLVTLGVTGGFRDEFQKKLLQFHAHLTVEPAGDASISQGSLKKEMGEEATQIRPYLYREVLMIHQGVVKGVVLKGVPLAAGPTAKGIVLGKSLAEKLNVRAGDFIKVLIPKGKEITARNTIRLQVGGTFSSGLYDIDEQFALIDLKELQKLFGLPSTTRGFEIQFRDPALAIPASEQLKEKFPAALIQNWAELNQPLLEAFTLEKTFFWIVIGFMVLVSILNLIGAILLNIFRRKKRIAILRALGMGEASLKALFAWEGFLLGVTGVLIGIGGGLGVLFALKRFPMIAIDPEVYFLEKLPLHLSGSDLLSVAIFSFALIVVTSVWVSSRVAKIPIREGLHGV